MAVTVRADPWRSLEPVPGTPASARRHRVRFGVLGPMRVSTDGNAVTLKAPMQRRLLASLLCRAGRPVAASTLIEAMWGCTPPPSCRKTMQAYMSRLRQAIGDDGCITHGEGGYTAAVGAGDLDALTFADLSARGRRARGRGDMETAGALFGQALALWRGPAYADTADVRFIADEAHRLEDEQLTVHEELAAVRLGLGRFSQVVVDLSELAGLHPYRERLHAVLMMALSRCGRQAEALEVYGRVRTTLREELGVEPGPMLRRVHEAVLRDGDGASVISEILESPRSGTAREPVRMGSPPARAGRPSMVPAPLTAPVPCHLPPDILDFTGRQGRLESLYRLFARREAAEPTVIATVTGAAGTGKTTLAVHVAHRLRAAFPDGQLYVDLRGSGPRPVAPATVLGRFLRALGAQEFPPPEGAEEQAELLRTVLAPRRVLVVLDDAAGESQIRPLLPGGPGCGVLVTSRLGLTGLSAHRMPLGPLSGASAYSLLARIAGAERVAAEPAAAAEILRLCAHLPLAVRIAGARLAAREHLSLSGLAARLRPEARRLDVLAAGDLSVRASLAGSYERLDAASRRALRLLGLTAPAAGFPAPLPASLLGTTVEDAERRLDPLVEVGLLRCCGSDAEGRLRYRLDDLVRLFVCERAGAE